MGLMSSRHPQTFWRLAYLLLPLWFVMGVALGAWVLCWPLLKPLGERTEVKVAFTGQGDNTLGPISDFQVVWSRTLRERLSNTPVQKPQENEHDRGLHYTLLGTAVESGESYAILRSQQGGIQIIKLGEQLDTFELTSIEPQRIGLIRSGNVTYLALPDELNQLLPEQVKTLKAEVKETKPTLSLSQSLEQLKKQEAKESLGKKVEDDVLKIEVRDIDSVRFISDTRLVPAQFNNGEQVGFCIDSIEKDSPVFRLGLRPGDVIVRVDGKELSGLNDLEQIYVSFDSDQPHQWDVRRGTRWLLVQIWPKEEKTYDAG